MKILFTFLFLIVSFSAFAISPREAWKNANMRDKVRLLNEYRDFYKQLDIEESKNLSEFKTSSFSHFFMNDAYAANASGMNCVYAGWPSKRVNNLCSSPQRQNPNYTSGNCAVSQLQCQPMLFGSDVCVPISTQSQRNLAFSNCSKQFAASKKTTEDVVNQIKENKKEEELFEFMDYAKEICSSGKQAQTSMCRRLEGALDSMKSAAERLKDSLKAPTQEKVVKLPEVVIDDKKIEVPTPTDIKLLEAVGTMAKLPPIEPKVEVICEDPTDEELTLTGKLYERDAPRFSNTQYIGSKTNGQKFWDDRYTKYKESPDEIPSGFSFTNTGPNAVASGSPIDPSEKVERQWSFTTEDGSKQESYLWITDDAGSGKLSELMETIILVVPRKFQPSVEIVGDDMVVSLPTGEKVIYDKMTRTVKSGVLKEGKVDLTPNRFNRKFAPISYSGTGISIRVDKRGEDPRLLGGSATVTQNGATCKVPVTELWTSKTNFKYGDDAKLLSFLNTKCGNKFKM